MKGKPIVVLALVILFLVILPGWSLAATVKALDMPNVVQPYNGNLGTIEIDGLYLNGPDQISVILPKGVTFMVRDPDQLISVPVFLPDTSVLNGVYQQQGPGFSNAYIDPGGMMLNFTIAPSDVPEARANSGTVLIKMPLSLVNAEPGAINVTIKDTAFQVFSGDTPVGSQMRNATTPDVIKQLDLKAGGAGTYALQITTLARGGAAGAGSNLWFDLPAHFVWQEPVLAVSGGWSKNSLSASVTQNDQGNSRLLLVINSSPAGTAQVRLDGEVDADPGATPGKIIVSYGGSDPGIGVNNTLVLGQCDPVPNTPVTTGVSSQGSSAVQPEPAIEAREIEFTSDKKSYLVNGREFSMDVAPFYQDGRLDVPVRYLAYALGIPEEGVNWDNHSQTVELQTKGISLSLTAGKDIYYANGQQKRMDTVPIVRGNRLFLPARFVAEAFGCQVGFESGTVKITGPGK
ncbi:copper amine oxidase N-terminal domain-containing protein [Desulfotomaculum copahuensis]|uniref:Copper amine oxidase-like N-terminal domain-containing protein n=1 Tax=Desulfotomaculum copahuensis TaxID=1838280 RepID=A0A1B7LBF4_9FIRM|nr:copper amine oxidase N-terminal domain-containing protein [Desulfotomaculum copahuensis]OAT79804.1 hypothetical protein A6M21_15260 [Desulfotomaculum copahuensis]